MIKNKVDTKGNVMKTFAGIDFGWEYTTALRVFYHMF